MKCQSRSVKVTVKVIGLTHAREWRIRAAVARHFDDGRLNTEVTFRALVTNTDIRRCGRVGTARAHVARVTRVSGAYL